MKVLIQETVEQDFHTFTIRLPRTLCDQLDRVATSKGLHRSTLIRAILKSVVEDSKAVVRVSRVKSP